jgi:hypothetical protein
MDDFLHNIHVKTPKTLTPSRTPIEINSGVLHLLPPASPPAHSDTTEFIIHLEPNYFRLQYIVLMIGSMLVLGTCVIFAKKYKGFVTSM